MNQLKAKLSRRSFIETSALGAAGMMLATSRGSLGGVRGAGERVNVGFIGPGGQGSTLRAASG